MSVYNYGQRIKRAERLTGIPQGRQINPTLALLFLFPGLLLVIPGIVHYWYVTKHQNMALRAAAGLPFDGATTTPATFGTVASTPPAAGSTRAPEAPADPFGPSSNP